MGIGYLDRKIEKLSLLKGHLSREQNDTRDAHLGDASTRGRKKCKCPEVEWLSVRGAARRSVQGAGRRGWDARQHWPFACVHRSNTDF